VSVLLDALKKAAEDKKNADNLIADKDQDSNSSVSFSDSQDDSNFDLKLAAPDNDNSSIDSFEEGLNETDNLPIDNDEVNVSPEEELPTFSLKSVTETESEAIVTPDVDFQIKLQPEEPLNVEEPDTSDNDLASLIDSLDIEDSVKVDQVGLEHSESASANMLAGLSVEQQAQDSLGTVEDKTAIRSEEATNADDFKWSMDDLPGYEEPTQINDNKALQANSLSQNPILINGENTPPKTNKKYATSTRIIVSLVVVLLFIGIGFYGMLYYQEQNEDLEFSMRKYNLSKMQFTQPKPVSEPSKVEIESFEDTSTLNIVSDKVISLGASIKDAVTNQLNGDSQNQTDVKDSSIQLATSSTKSESLPSTNIADSNESSVKRIGSNTQRSGFESVTAKRTTQYTSSKKPTTELKSLNSNSPGSLVTITTARSSISKAYSAYESGDFQQANKMFTEAIAKEPRNINALLGLGGVAVAQGNNYAALNFYQKVLDVEANNIYAFESIANLSGKMPLNKAWENELFEMSLKYPGSAVLQYAKGNILAKKTDWLAAQESYFNAYALDSANPDYMVNLAVSYDHLGKYELAAQYYTQALGFASGANASFDKKHVRNRLISLRQFISQDN